VRDFVRAPGVGRVVFELGKETERVGLRKVGETLVLFCSWVFGLCELSDGVRSIMMLATQWIIVSVLGLLWTGSLCFCWRRQQCRENVLRVKYDWVAHAFEFSAGSRRTLHRWRTLHLYSLTGSIINNYPLTNLISEMSSAIGDAFSKAGFRKFLPAQPLIMVLIATHSYF
jgi:hypothetical protein